MRRIVCFLGVVVLLLCSACATAENMVSVLKKGDQGTEVIALQQRLIELCYLSGQASGKYDSATKKAVKAFQKDFGLKATGNADSETQGLLFADDSWSVRYNKLPRVTEKQFAAAANKAVKALNGKKFKYSKGLTIEMNASYISNVMRMEWHDKDGSSVWIEIYFDEDHQFDENGFTLKTGMKRKATKFLAADDLCVTTSIAIGQKHYTKADSFVEVTDQEVILDLLRFPAEEECIQKLCDGKLNLFVYSEKNGWSTSEGFFLKSGEMGKKLQSQFKTFWKAISGNTLLKNRAIAQICLSHMNAEEQKESNIAVLAPFELRCGNHFGDSRSMVATKETLTPDAIVNNRAYYKGTIGDFKNCEVVYEFSEQDNLIDMACIYKPDSQSHATQCYNTLYDELSVMYGSPSSTENYSSENPRSAAYTSARTLTITAPKSGYIHTARWQLKQSKVQIDLIHIYFKNYDNKRYDDVIVGYHALDN